MVRGNSVPSPDYPRVLFPTRTSTYFLPASASRPSATYLWQVMLPYSTQQILSTVEMCPVAYSWHVLWLLISINHKIRFSACGFCVIRSFSSQRAVTYGECRKHNPNGRIQNCKQQQLSFYTEKRLQLTQSSSVSPDFLAFKLFCITAVASVDSCCLNNLGREKF